MKKEIKNIVLPSGSHDVEVISFNEQDQQILWNIYNHWRSLSKELKEIGGREINIPEGLSEGVFCLAMGEDVVRIVGHINGEKSSFDCFDLKRNKRIQVKASSVRKDLTSFGPRSVWDELYFLDFFVDGNWDGSVKIYKIDIDINRLKVNKTETFLDQKEQKRRPRFSIQKEIIEKMRLQPIKVFRLYGR